MAKSLKKKVKFQKEVPVTGKPAKKAGKKKGK